MSIFKGVPFPYSTEIKDVPLESRPNVQLASQHHSYYMVLKQIRSDLIGSKLRTSGSLMFDKFIEEFLNIPIEAKNYYPPENLTKLESFIIELERHDIDPIGLHCVIYYILKDFDITKAEKYINQTSKIGNKVPQCLYDIINAIYFIDRFNILKSLRYLNNIDDFSCTPQSLIDHFIKLSNIIPYHGDINKKGAHITELRNYMDVSTCKPSARSVISMIRALKKPVWELSTDSQLMYLDSMTDLNPGLSIRLMEESKGNYDNSISWSLMLKLIVIKVLIKSVKQQRVLKKLWESNEATTIQFDELFRSVGMFELIDTKIDPQVTSTLEDLLSQTKTIEEDIMRGKYPKYFQKLDDYHKEIKKCAKNLLIWKYGMMNSDRFYGLIQGTELEGVL
jgi:hypothetical protein